MAGCGAEPLPDGLPSELDCSSCHGSEQNAAPPIATDGSSGTEETGVGAHQAHVNDGTTRGAHSCEDCHLVPATVQDVGHMDGSPAELTWGALATNDGLEPQWDRDEQRCTNVYCHGATQSGGSNTEPSWTTVDGSQAACGTCHGHPPPSPHPGTDSCSMCHSETVKPSGEIDVEGGKHIDGE